ncbi:rCG23632, partial [Rattus norvegicus]
MKFILAPLCLPTCLLTGTMSSSSLVDAKNKGSYQ